MYPGKKYIKHSRELKITIVVIYNLCLHHIIKKRQHYGSLNRFPVFYFTRIGSRNPISIILVYIPQGIRFASEAWTYIQTHQHLTNKNQIQLQPLQKCNNYYYIISSTVSLKLSIVITFSIASNFMLVQSATFTLFLIQWL